MSPEISAALLGRIRAVEAGRPAPSVPVRVVLEDGRPPRFERSTS